MAKRSDSTGRGRRSSLRPKRRGRRIASQAPPARRSLLPSLQLEAMPEESLNALVDEALTESEPPVDETVLESEPPVDEQGAELQGAGDRLALTPTPDQVVVEDGAELDAQGLDAQGLDAQGLDASDEEQDEESDSPSEARIEELTPQSTTDVLVVPSARRSRFSRPPAPMLGFGSARPSVEIAIRNSTVPQSWLDEEDEQEQEFEPSSQEQAGEPESGDVDSESPPAAGVEPFEAYEDEDEEPPSSELSPSHPAVERPSFDEQTMESSAPAELRRELNSEPIHVGDESAPSSAALQASGLPKEGEGGRGMLWLLVLGAIGLVVGLVSRSGDDATSPEASSSAVAEPAAAAPPPAPSVAASAEAATAAAPKATDLNPDLDETLAGDPSGASDYKAVEETTVRLLTEHDPAAEGWARRMIQLRPKHAHGYRCLGAALQNKGDLKGARKAFDDCASFAKTGNVVECNQLGGVAR